MWCIGSAAAARGSRGQAVEGARDKRRGGRRGRRCRLPPADPSRPPRSAAASPCTSSSCGRRHAEGRRRVPVHREQGSQCCALHTRAAVPPASSSQRQQPTAGAPSARVGHVAGRGKRGQRVAVHKHKARAREEPQQQRHARRVHRALDHQRPRLAAPRPPQRHLRKAEGRGVGDRATGSASSAPHPRPLLGSRPSGHSAAGGRKPARPGAPAPAHPPFCKTTARRPATPRGPPRGRPGSRKAARSGASRASSRAAGTR